ncbi:MAG: GNAT family N-acetyltransferase [Crocinitomicaceae bacterium]|nr:GNAT family N-acetyltransferase [Crocinitomicaceae bacterium]
MKSKPKTTYYKQSSDRLLFRSLTVEDVELWMPFFNSEDYHRFLGQDISKPADARAHVWIDRQIQRKKDGVYGQLAVIEKSSGKFMGVGGIIHRELYGNDDLEITYSLLPEFWGKGYARELAKHFIDYAKAETDTKSVMSMIHPENEASKKVALANGLTFDGMAKFMRIPVEVYRLKF